MSIGFPFLSSKIFVSGKSKSIEPLFFLFALKINQLGIFISNFGYGMKTAKEEVHPKEIQKLLGKVEGTPEEALSLSVSRSASSALRSILEERSATWGRIAS